jgi:hypothetical protein
MPIRILIAVFLLAVPPSVTFAFASNGPVDSVVVLRETQIQASLDLYPEILDTAQPKQHLPLIRLITDQYGIVWAEVRLDEEKTGYLTDIIAIRMALDDLNTILAEVSEEELAGWDQETIESIRGAKLEIGMTRTQLLLARGVPLGRRAIGAIEELSYPREKILLSDGKVMAFTDVHRLVLDKAVRIQLDAGDSAFTPGGGRWEEVPVGLQTYRIDVSGTGAGRFRVQVPVQGTYRLHASWMVTEKSSSQVVFRVLQRREEITVFQANQRLHNLKSVELGEMDLSADGTILIEVSAKDGSPFSIGELTLEYVNEPLPVATTSRASE